MPNFPVLDVWSPLVRAAVLFFKEKLICILISSFLQSQQSSKKLDSVFHSKEKEENDEDIPKKKLSKIDSKEDEDKKKADTANEKKETIRNLIEKIPTAKDELFQFPIKMDMIDQVSVCFVVCLFGLFTLHGTLFGVVFADI